MAAATGGGQLELSRLRLGPRRRRFRRGGGPRSRITGRLRARNGSGEVSGQRDSLRGGAAEVVIETGSGGARIRPCGGSASR